MKKRTTTNFTIGPDGLSKEQKERVIRGERFTKDMSVIATFLSRCREAHQKDGYFYYLTQNLLASYSHYKFLNIKQKMELSQRQAIMRGLDAEDPANYLFEYVWPEPEWLSPDDDDYAEFASYLNVGSIYDFIDKDKYELISNSLDHYLDSKEYKLSVSICLVLEKVLNILRQKNEAWFWPVYYEYIYLHHEEMNSKDKIEAAGTSRAMYYRNLSNGITFVSEMIFSRYGELYSYGKNTKKEKLVDELFQHLEEATAIAIRLLDNPFYLKSIDNLKDTAEYAAVIDHDKEMWGEGHDTAISRIRLLYSRMKEDGHANDFLKILDSNDSQLLKKYLIKYRIP